MLGFCRKPVYVIGAERCRWKFVEFHKTLRDRGLVRPFTGLEDVSSSFWPFGYHPNKEKNNVNYSAFLVIEICCMKIDRCLIIFTCMFSCHPTVSSYQAHEMFSFISYLFACICSFQSGNWVLWHLSLFGILQF